MRRIFHVYASNDSTYQEIDLPASDYEMLDLMERLQLKPGQPPYLEVLKCHDYNFLAEQLQEQPNIYQLNGLAKQLEGLDDFSKTAFEGLVRMESKKGSGPVPLSQLIDFACGTECCHVIDNVVSDYGLGRFYAENGFVAGAEDLSDAAFELLDFKKIGREYRIADHGVFTSLGYVMRHSEVPHISETMDFKPHKPSYTILLNAAPMPFLKEQEQEQKPIPIQLPTTNDRLQETLEKLGCTSWSSVMTAILDCSVPAWNHKMFLDEEIPQVFQLAEKLQQLDMERRLTKYKAILAATDCQEVADAINFANKVDEYDLIPDVRTLAEAAEDDLHISIDSITLERLLPYIDLPGYGAAMLERYNAKLTSYGRLDHGGEPIQLTQDVPDQTQGPSMTMQ